MTRPARDFQLAETRAFFDDAAGGWSDRFRPEAEMAPRKTLFAGVVGARLPSGSALLDYGCGSGDITRHLSGLGYAMTGCDISAPMIARAQESNSQIEWLALPDAPPAPLPFGHAQFDGVIASSVLEYVAAVDETLRELSRVLKPGGSLFVTVPDMRDGRRQRERLLRIAANTPVLSALLMRSRWSEGARYLRISINRWGTEQWRACLARAGLTPRETRPHQGPLLLLEAQKPAA